MGMNENGRGNCFICTPHKDNVLCVCFKPVYMCELEVLEEEGHFDKTDEDYDYNFTGHWSGQEGE